MNKLTSLDIKDFQSIKEAHIPLEGNFVCLVGASNLGKSAILRSLRALIRNAPAPGLVRQGEKNFTVTASFSDGSAETLKKGDKVSEFILRNVEGSESVYAKAGASSVPDEIADLWKLPDFCLSTQHDKPFMLAESSSEVAKTLGELTNASMLMEAVREANRQRAEALNEEKARTKEADECRTELLTHTGLKIKSDALVKARETLVVAKNIKLKKDLLFDLIKSVTVNEQTLQEVSRNTSLLDVSSQLNEAEIAVEKVCQLLKLTSFYSKIIEQIAQTEKIISSLTSDLETLERDIHNALTDAGTCPLCGATTQNEEESDKKC